MFSSNLPVPPWVLASQEHLQVLACPGIHKKCSLIIISLTKFIWKSNRNTPQSLFPQMLYLMTQAPVHKKDYLGVDFISLSGALDSCFIHIYLKTNISWWAEVSNAAFVALEGAEEGEKY